MILEGLVEIYAIVPLFYYFFSDIFYDKLFPVLSILNKFRLLTNLMLALFRMGLCGAAQGR